MEENIRKKHTEWESVIKSGAFVEILLKTEKGYSVYKSLIQDVESGFFWISAPTKGRMEIHLKPEEKIKFSYQGSDARYEFEAEVLGEKREKAGKRFQFQIPKTGWRIQRRNFFRLAIALTAFFRGVEETYYDNTHHLQPIGERSKCYVSDVSGGGVSVYANPRVEPQGFFELEFQIETKSGVKKFQEMVRIVRAQDVRNRSGYGGYAYEYGGYFFSMDDKVREELVHFIYEQQIKMAHRVR